MKISNFFALSAPMATRQRQLCAPKDTHQLYVI